MSAIPIGTINPSFIGVIEKVSGIVHKISGNRLGEKQAYMIETRVRKRMTELGIKEAPKYLEYIDQNLEKESKVLVGLITTHHTFFFREFTHFEMLKKMLPSIVALAKKRGDKTIKIWSAACSRGQEVYSIAMFFEHYLKEIDPTMSFKILGTDIDAESVKIGSNGVYLYNEIKEVPMNLLGNHWARGTGDISMYAKIKSTIKSKCEFRQGNLLTVSESARNEKFDIIFCRNVFIYFEPYQIEQITKELMNHLHADGIFFSGISEPLSGLKLSINCIGPSAYMLKTATSETLGEEYSLANRTSTNIKAPLDTLKPNFTSLSLPTSTPSFLPTPEILKVMCVDDSPSIMTLLKRILTKEEGFEVVATAVNGKEAMEKLKTTKVDFVTLDIHMPEMDGLSYLEKNFTKLHPPVMIISSASRSDSEVAMKALKLGASDFVEKPALNNLEERGEEIRTKLRSIKQNYNKKPMISSVDKESQRQFVILNPEKKIRVMIASLSDLSKIKAFYNGLDKSQPGAFIFFEGQGEILEAIAKEHTKDFKQSVVYYDKPEISIEPNKIYFADFKTHYLNISKKFVNYPCSILVFGNISSHSAKAVACWKNVQLLIEDFGDNGNQVHSLKSYSTDIIPATSFPYISCRYLSLK